jgi:hypothetical protein
MASELKIENRRGGSVMSELPISTLKQLVFGDNMDLDKSGDVDELPNPFEQLKHDGAVRAALAKSDKRVSVAFDWAVPSADDVDDDTTTQLYKSPMVVRDDGPRTLAKKLGITRTEQVVTESGDVWLHGFGSDGELIDARLLRCADE